MPIFEPTDPEALDYVAYMLDPDAKGKRVSLPRGSIFERMPAGDMFQLAVRIALTCQRADKPASGLPIEPEFIELAGRAILNWPAGFLELVENTPAKNNDKPVGWFKQKPLRQLLFEPTLSSEIRREIKKLVEANRRLEVLARPSVPGAPSASQHTCQGLQRPRSALFKLLRSEASDPPTASSLETIVRVLRDIKEVRRFSRTTALTVPDVWRLFSSGLAPELDPVLGKYGWKPPTVLDGTLRENLDRVVRRGMGVGTLDIVSARFALDPRMKSSWVSIVRAVVNGRLTVWRDNSGTGLVGSLVLNDFEGLRTVLNQMDDGPDDADVEVTQEELSMFMRKSRPYATHFVQSGVMTGPTNIRSFANFRSDWAFGFELEALSVIARLPGVSKKLRSSSVERIDCGPAKLWSRRQSLELLGLAAVPEKAH
ncbi:hypothetical protein [Rhizobium leguminosarum]|uniref:Uncharacterized protein n=1 Tax=Rhizobium leguminosarum TaxID=384 RepID=A0A6P0D8V2_RHILE|nr:hypothetical protein [Rhizobium leguminosarum]MBY5494709.1 hypothetical protein [Rhizobium leguminosarum]MBY5524682.1 hypothetical protein [Rhizobium leguminosarum]NEK48545.1 hypothetical protein [Rhizobium leguminosarum]TBY34476.1 hypothetical protein E0H55_15280 [Rhizobium leguminosarum bv. viciae]TBY42414.1 hypothetical protein E0H60_03315 [Rhizobium leguminosarum bv. viciae]